MRLRFVLGVVLLLVPLPCAAASGSVLTVPILMYHHIRPLKEAPDKAGRALSVSPEKFRSQMQWLDKEEFRTVTLDTLALIAKRKRPIYRKLAVVTFDDGYDNAFTMAFPVLRERNQAGVFFLPVGLIGKPGYLSEAQVRALSGSGMEIGSHTIHHVPLTSLTIADAMTELSESRRQIAWITKKRVISLSYPYGDKDGVVERLAKMTGYVMAVTVRPGIASLFDDFLLLPRIKMGDGTDLSIELR